MNSIWTCWMTLALAAGSSPEIIAHRGESADAPENTMAAFRLAWERDVGAIELDLHLTVDDRLVVIHDADTERTCGVKHIIKTSRYEDLSNLDAGTWKGPQFQRERIVTLEDVLAELPDGKRCIIEVKVGPESVPALVRAVRSADKAASQLAVISFKHETIAEVRRQLPELQTLWLTSFKEDEATKQLKPTVDEIIARAKEIDAHGVNVSYKGPIDAAFAERVKAAGLLFYVWTVDDAGEALRLQQLGVDGITTNKAAWLRDILAE